MIKIEKAEVMGWEHAIRGMRNPMNSWDRSDSGFCRCGLGGMWCENCMEASDCQRIYHDGSFQVGKNDHALMMRLATAGSVHGKFRRMITVYADITAPLYWWKEFDTYKVGTVANSCSTMHKIHEKEFTLDDFSHEHLEGRDLVPDHDYQNTVDVFDLIIESLNFWREEYFKTYDKRAWWQMIQLLPSSYNQKRTVMLNYEVLANIYEYRREHKLDEWREFCEWIESLPYSEIITCNAEKTESAENGWISVNESRPEGDKHDRVLVSAEMTVEEFQNSHGVKVTHWRPLPDNPNSQS